MRNLFPFFSDRLKYLMDKNNIKNANKLATELMEKELIPRKDHANTGAVLPLAEQIRNNEKTIHNHLTDKRYRNVEKVSVQWLKRYSTYFGCSMDFLFGYIHSPNHTIETANQITGLSEDAIKKLQTISQTNKRSAQSDILSCIIENENLEYLLALLGQSISYRINPHFLDGTDLHTGYDNRIASINIDGQEMNVYKDGLIDSVLSTHIMQELPTIADIYKHNHCLTPAQREKEYREFIKPYKAKLFAGELSEKDYAELEKKWLQDNTQCNNHTKK